MKSHLLSLCYIIVTLTIVTSTMIPAINDAYSIEYSGQTSNTGNYVTSEWITMEFYTTTDGTEFTKIEAPSLISPEITYLEKTDRGITKKVINGTYALTPDNLYVKISEDNTSYIKGSYEVTPDVNIRSGNEDVKNVQHDIDFYHVDQNGTWMPNHHPLWNPKNITKCIYPSHSMNL